MRGSAGARRPDTPAARAVRFAHTESHARFATGPGSPVSRDRPRASGFRHADCRRTRRNARAGRLCRAGAPAPGHGVVEITHTDRLVAATVVGRTDRVRHRRCPVPARPQVTTRRAAR